MTKKDYDLAAKLIRGWAGCNFKSEQRAVIYAFIDFFLEDNPKFDSEKFKAACVNPKDCKI